MKSIPQTKLYGLDHLRTLAITLVFFYHYRIPIFAHPQWISDGAKFGWTGVDLFFVLSGFLISSQLFAQIAQGRSISIKEFFIKRLLRILPAFWFIVGVYFCFPAFHEREALAPLWKYLTFTQNFGIDLSRNGTFSHAWSLCVEEHFYLFLPLSIIALQFTRHLKKGYFFVIAFFILGFLLRNYIWNNIYEPMIGKESAGILWYKYVYYPTYNRLDGLLVGVSIAALYTFRPNVWARVSQQGNLLICTALAVLAGAYFLCYEELSYEASVFGFPLIGIGYGLLVMGAISPGSFLFKWKSRSTTFLAGLSYALYLSHKGMIHVVQTLLAQTIDPESNVMLFICIVSCICGALLLNLLIEKPFMKLRDKLLKKDTETSGLIHRSDYPSESIP